MADGGELNEISWSLQWAPKISKIGTLDGPGTIMIKMMRKTHYYNNPNGFIVGVKYYPNLIPTHRQGAVAQGQRDRAEDICQVMTQKLCEEETGAPFSEESSFTFEDGSLGNCCFWKTTRGRHAADKNEITPSPEGRPPTDIQEWIKSEEW